MKDVCNNCGRCIGSCHFDALDEGTYGYKIYIGGRWGKKIAQGRALGKIFTDKEEALAVIEKAILLFREQGKTGEHTWPEDATATRAGPRDPPAPSPARAP